MGDSLMAFSRPRLGPGLKTSGGGERRGCLLPWLREIRVSSACWKLGFHERLLHWLSFAISGAAIAILVQGQKGFSSSECNLGVRLAIWVLGVFGFKRREEAERGDFRWWGARGMRLHRRRT
jgi:hypothetical protein